MTNNDGDIYLDDTFGNSNSLERQLEPMVFDEYLRIKTESKPTYFDSNGFDAPIVKESIYVDITENNFKSNTYSLSDPAYISESSLSHRSLNADSLKKS